MSAYTGPFPFTNTGTIDSISVTDMTVSGSITNAGAITPGGITITGSTVGWLDREQRLGRGRHQHRRRQHNSKQHRRRHFD